MTSPRCWLLFILLCGWIQPRADAAAHYSIERFRLQESLDAHSVMLLTPIVEAAAVLDLPADSWKPVSDQHRFATNSSLIWMKTKVQNRLQVPVQVTFRLKTTLFSSARFFVLDQATLLEQTHASAGSRAYDFMHGMHPSHGMSLNPGEERLILVSMESEAPRDVHWEIWDTESHRRESIQSQLRWTFLLATLLLVVLLAFGFGLTQKRSIPLAVALYSSLALLFLVRLTQWPLLAIFWEALDEALPPSLHIFCAMQASLLMLLRRLSYGLEPRRRIRKFHWLALAILVLYLSLIALLHQDQSLLFMLAPELLLLAMLIHVERQASLQKHPRQLMIRLLLGQQGLLLLLHTLILFDSFPLWRLPETWLWLQAFSSGSLLFMGMKSSRPTRSAASVAATPTAEGQTLLHPEKTANFLHEQWLHAEKMAALGTFTNGLANELNNPLAIIAGHRFRLSSMIDSRSFNIHEFEKSLGKIDQAVNRMIAVIDALKVYSQDPQGQEIFKTFSLRETIKYTIDLCRDKVGSCGIKLSTPELGDATMEGHQGQIIQVLLILVDNAIDALEQVSDKSIRIELQPMPDSIRIAVMDSGPGVPLGLRNKIWDPFFTTKDPFRHKGLGLSIASGIMSNHRGRILLDESTPETRFVLELPRTRRPLGIVPLEARI